MLCSGENTGNGYRRFWLNSGWKAPEGTLKTLGERLQSGEKGRTGAYQDSPSSKRVALGAWRVGEEDAGWLCRFVHILVQRLRGSPRSSSIHLSPARWADFLVIF